MQTFDTVLKSVSFSVLGGRDSICLALRVSLSLIQPLFRDELDYWSGLIPSPLSTSTLSAILVAQEVCRRHLDFQQENLLLRLFCEN